MASAQAFAAKHGIARAHGSYEALIADPDLDAVYVLVPTSMHGRWIRAALEAGKHVLCEKPFTANAAEAREIAELAAKSDRVVMEAVQFRHHPLTLRVEEIIASGELGKLELVDVALCVPLRNVLSQLLQLLPCRWRDNGCRKLFGPYAAHVRRLDPGSCFGAGETTRSSGGPGHDGRVAICKRAHRQAPRLDVVVGSAAGYRQGGWRPRRAACIQSSGTSPFPSTLDPIWQRKACGAFPAARHLRVSAGRFRCGGAARRTGEDDAGRGGREHGRHRCDLSRRRPSGPRA